MGEPVKIEEEAYEEMEEEREEEFEIKTKGETVIVCLNETDKAQSEEETRDTDGDEPVTVFMRKTFKLSTERAARILSDVLDGSIDASKIAETAPVSPRAGEVYLIDIAKLGDRKEALHDGYYWRHDGNKKYPKSLSLSGYMKVQSKKKAGGVKICMTVIKSIYKVKDGRSERGFSNVFQRHTYYSMDHDRYMLIHYFGNEQDLTSESLRGVIAVRTPKTPSRMKGPNKKRLMTTCFNCLNAPEDVANKTVTHSRLNRKLHDKKGDMFKAELTIMEAIEEVMEGVLTKSVLKRYANNFMCHDCTLVLRKAINRRTEAESNLRELHERIDKISNSDRRKYYRENYATDKTGRCWGCMLEFCKSGDKKKEKYGRHCLEMSLISGMTVMEGIETMLEDEAESLFGLSPKRLFICKQCYHLMRMVVKAQCSFDNLQAHFTGRTHPRGLMAELQGIVADSDDEAYTIPPLIDNSDLDDYDEEAEYQDGGFDVDDEDDDDEGVSGEEKDLSSQKRAAGSSAIGSPTAKKQKMDGSEPSGDTEVGDKVDTEVTVTEEVDGKEGGKKISIRLTAIKPKDQVIEISPIKIQTPLVHTGGPIKAVSLEESAADSWELVYDERSAGRAGLVRLVLEIAGVQYTDCDSPEVHSTHPCLPVIRKGNEEVSHAVVICRFIGEEYALSPLTVEDKLQADQISQYCYEFLTEGGFAGYGNCVMAKEELPFDEQGMEVFVQRFVKDRLPMWLSFFEDLLKKNNNGKGYAVGNTLTYADLTLYHTLQTTCYRFPSEYVQADVETLKAYSRRIGSLNNMKNYHKSPSYKGVTSYSF